MEFTRGKDPKDIIRTKFVQLCIELDKRAAEQGFEKVLIDYKNRTDTITRICTYYIGDLHVELIMDRANTTEDDPYLYCTIGVLPEVFDGTITSYPIELEKIIQPNYFNFLKEKYNIYK